MTDVSSPPVPSGFYQAFYPASILLPDGEVWRRTKIYLADTGLYVYTAAPTGGVDRVPDFYAATAPVGAFGRPVGNARNGYVVLLADGRSVTITGGGGCGCGSPLRRWSPSWATAMLPWPA